MRSNLTLLILIVALCSLNLSCSGGSSSPSGPVYPTSNLPNGPTLAPLSGNNVMPLTVNGTTCAAGSYANKPCVSVTICSPINGNCQTISDILLDTGSYGLRVFASVLNSNIILTQESNIKGSIAECVNFGDGSSEWGPVAQANLGLAGEPSTEVPIMIIDQSYGSPPSPCVAPNSTPDTSPSQAGFNGILGVGLLAQDCGLGCEPPNSGNGYYYACQGNVCSGVGVLLSQQVTNPVSLLPTDNNGVIVELPSVPYGGVSSINGYLVLGIGTQSNNTPTGVTAYTADSVAQFTTTYNNST